MTSTQKLTKKIDEIYNAHYDEINALETRGPRGGSNAANIDGWSAPGNGTITRAANASRMPVLKWWAGSHPTSSGALPSCVIEDIIDAYDAIFGGVK